MAPRAETHSGLRTAKHLRKSVDLCIRSVEQCLCVSRSNELPQPWIAGNVTTLASTFLRLRARSSQPFAIEERPWLSSD
jgi:hypothetical protein